MEYFAEKGERKAGGDLKGRCLRCMEGGRAAVAAAREKRSGGMARQRDGRFVDWKLGGREENEAMPGEE